MNQSCENTLLENWLNEMQLPIEVYKEPILDEKVINIVKLACDTFKQDIQVFFMTVDVAEEYIYLKELRHEKISDCFLAVTVIIFITSKYLGGGADLKIPLIEKFMLKISGYMYHCGTIMKAEQEILAVLQYKLPFSTTLDDLNTFLEKLMRQYRLQEVLRPLCVQILILIYSVKKQLFENLRKLYKDEKQTFQCLICSKLYLPAGILVSALKTTNYQFILDIDGLLQDLKFVIKIHPDHIHALSAVIMNMMNS